jgi:hypothetical protein
LLIIAAERIDIDKQEDAGYDARNF